MPMNQVENSNTTIFTYTYLFMISSTCNFLLGVSYLTYFVKIPVAKTRYYSLKLHLVWHKWIDLIRIHWHPPQKKRL